MNSYEWLNKYLLAKPGAVKDFKKKWGWWRYQVGGKMCAATLHPSDKYDPAYANKDLLNLKYEPVLAELLRKEHAEVLPDFYSDKHCWNSVDLGGGLTDNLLIQMCDDLYQLVFDKLTKKAQKEILACLLQKG